VEPTSSRQLEQKALIAQREEARLHKKWPESDKLRDELSKQDVSLRNTEDGVIWRRL